MDPQTVVRAVLARRKGIEFDPRKAGRGRGGDELSTAARKYGVAEHAKSFGAVPEAIENHVLGLVDYTRINATLSSGLGMRTPWEVFLAGFLDGYSVARELTKSAGAPKKIGSKGAVTQFVKTAAERWAAAEGTLAPFFEPLLGELFTLHGEGLRKATAAAFVVGARLRCLEFGANHDLLAPLFDGPKKVQGAAIPKGKASPNEDLVSAILASPDDDAARLVYADFLSTSDDPRGEFIQLQCALGNSIRNAGASSTDPAKPVENGAEMVKRAEALLKHSKGKWLEGLRLSNSTWARGFPRDGYCDAIEFVENAAYDRAPLDGISLIHWSGKVAEATFARAKHPTLRRFWFGSGFGPKVLHVFGAPVFADARALAAAFWDEAPIPAKALEALDKANFPRLEEFEGPAEVLAALDHAKCPRLRTFKVDAWRLEPVVGTRLWRQLTRLETFRLDGEAEFGILKSAESLEVLSVVSVQCDEQRLRQLVASAPPSLKTLEGGFCELAPNLVDMLGARFTLVASS